MSYLSRVPANSDTIFNLPTVLATLISISLHGLLWVVAPALNASSKPGVNERRTVGIVQLTPDEMGRLPEYSLPQPKLPKLPLPSPTNILPPLPPVQSYSSLPPIPNPPPYIPPLPQSSPQDIPTERSSQKRSTSRRPEIKLKENAPAFQPEIKIESRQTTQNPLTRERPITPKPSTTSQQSDIAKKTDNGVTSNDRLPTFPPGTLSPPIPPSNTDVVPRETTQPITPSNLEAHLPSFYPKPSDVPTRQQPSQDFTDSLVKYRNNYDPSGTTPESAAGKLSNWLKQLSVSPEITRMPGTILLKSPVNEKLPDVNQASVAVLVTPKGKIEGKAELIRSTGYPTLDRAALENIQKRRIFPPTRKYEVYLYRIEIDQTNLTSSPGSSSNG